MIAFDKLIGLAIAAALAGYPLVAAFTHAMGVENNPVSLAYRGGLSVAFLICVNNLRSLRLQRHSDLVVTLLVVFIIAYAFRIFYSTLISNENLSRAVEFYYIWGIIGCLFPTAITVLQKRSPDFSAFFGLVFFMFLSACVLALLFGSSSKLSESGYLHATGRFQLVALNPISLANAGATLCLLSIWRVWNYERNVTYVWRWLYLGSFMLGLYLIFLTGSRGPLISLMVGLFSMFYFQSFGRKIVLIIAVCLFVVASFTYMAHQAEVLNIGTITRFSFTGSSDDRSTQGRLISVSSALRDAIDNPLLGAQLEERITRWYPHNLFVEALMATGLVFGSMFIFVTLSVVRMSLFAIRHRYSYSWVSLIFLQHFAQGMFSSGLYTAIDFWVSMSAAYLASSVPHRAGIAKGVCPAYASGRA